MGIDGGFSQENGILISPKGAKFFYNSYNEFANGNNHGIRDLNYSDLSKSELSSLSPQEILYWCYINDVAYEEFCKTSLLHKDIQRWTIHPGPFDDDSHVIIANGLIEDEARKISERDDVEYLPIFRNNENVIYKHIANMFTERYLYSRLLNGSPDFIINDFLKNTISRDYFGDFNVNDYYSSFNEFFTQYTLPYREQARNIELSDSSSLLDLFDLQDDLLKPNDLLHDIKDYIETSKRKLENPENPTQPISSGDDELEL